MKLSSPYFILFAVLFFSQITFSWDEDCFKNTYAEAQNNFKTLSNEFATMNPQYKVGAETIAGATIDYLYLMNKSEAPLILIQSGMHGVEGHVGSAVQCFLLRSLKRSPVHDVNFIFIHGINAHGFEHNRRVNHNNVDLNRNFFEDASGYQTTNEGYSKLEHFLNPKEPTKIHWLSKPQFLGSTLIQLIQSSKDAIKRALLKGQYQYPKGISFGGTQLEPQNQVLLQLWTRFGSLHEKLLLIDLHTGYGERGRLHLMSHSSHAEDAERLQKLFTPTSVDFGDHKDFYQTTGDGVAAFVKKFRAKNANGVAFEYGTLNSQNLMGSLDSLYRLIIENQGFQFGFADESSEKKTRNLFIEMFYPSDPVWRQSVLQQTQVEFEKVLKRINQ